MPAAMPEPPGLLVQRVIVVVESGTAITPNRDILIYLVSSRQLGTRGFGTTWPATGTPTLTSTCYTGLRAACNEPVAATTVRRALGCFPAPLPRLNASELRHAFPAASNSEPGCFAFGVRPSSLGGKSYDFVPN